jgi:hypothetical protein
VRHGSVLHDDGDGVPVRVVVAGIDQARDVEQGPVHPVGDEAGDVGRDHVQPVTLRDPLERDALPAGPRGDRRRLAAVHVPRERDLVARDQGDGRGQRCARRPERHRPDRGAVVPLRRQGAERPRRYTRTHRNRDDHRGCCCTSSGAHLLSPS